MTSIHPHSLKMGRVIIEVGRWDIIKLRGARCRRQIEIYGSLVTLRSDWGILEMSRRNTRGLAPFVYT